MLINEGLVVIMLQAIMEMSILMLPLFLLIRLLEVRFQMLGELILLGFLMDITNVIKILYLTFQKCVVPYQMVGLIKL